MTFSLAVVVWNQPYDHPILIGLGAEDLWDVRPRLRGLSFILEISLTLYLDERDSLAYLFSPLWDPLHNSQTYHPENKSEHGPCFFETSSGYCWCRQIKCSFLIVETKILKRFSWILQPDFILPSNPTLEPSHSANMLSYFLWVHYYLTPCTQRSLYWSAPWGWARSRTNWVLG